MNTEIILILDCSGSMLSIKPSVIDGYNQFLKEQKEFKGTAKISVAHFNDTCRILLSGQHLPIVQNLTEKNYIPEGMTALYDAIGEVLETQGKRIHDEKWAEVVMVVIITDGQENASSRYRASDIKQMIEHAQNHQWKFIYLGANQDAMLNAEKIGIDPTFVRGWQTTEEGTKDAYIYTSSTACLLRDPQAMNNQKLKELHKKLKTA